MPTLLVFPQITLADVVTQATTLGLDVAELLDATGPYFDRRISLGEDDPRQARDPETELVRSLFLPLEVLAELEVGDLWQALAEKTQQGAVLAHPASPTFLGLPVRARKATGLRTALVIRPVGVRTLMTQLDKPSWDFRPMPSETLGSEGADAELVARLTELVRPTTGSGELLGAHPRPRLLAILATTVTAVLSEDADKRSDHRRGAKLVRADVYERTVEGMGLGPFFQAIRRILEVDHPDHVPVQVAWPRPTDPVRDVAILERRGQRDPYLALNAPLLTKLK